MTSLAAARWREIGPAARRLILTGAGIGWVGLTLTDGVWTIALTALGIAVAGLGAVWSQSTDGPDRAAAATAAQSGVEAGTCPDRATEPDPDDEMDDDAPSGDVVTAVVRVGSTPPATAAVFQGDLWALFPAPDPVALWFRRELVALGWTDGDPLDALSASIVSILQRASEPQLTALTGRQVRELEAPEPEMLTSPDRPAITTGGHRV